MLFFHPAAWYLSRRVDRARGLLRRPRREGRRRPDGLRLVAAPFRRAPLAGRATRLAAPALDGVAAPNCAAGSLACSTSPTSPLSGSPGRACSRWPWSRPWPAAWCRLLWAEPGTNPQEARPAAEAKTAGDPVPAIAEDQADRVHSVTGRVLDVEGKPIPHATLSARVVDGRGQPAPARIEYRIRANSMARCGPRVSAARREKTIGSRRWSLSVSRS